MRKFTSFVAICFLGLIGIAFLLIFMGFRINTTNSIPIGLYRITNIKNLKNSFVIFCPEDREAFKLGLERGYIGSGLCPGGYGYLMKKVVATKGDKVTVTSEGVFINSQLLPHSKPKLNDGMDRKLFPWKMMNYELKENEIMTTTNQNEWSFDARYYGPICVRQIKGVITPIWVKLNNFKL